MGQLANQMRALIEQMEALDRKHQQLIDAQVLDTRKALKEMEELARTT